MFISFKGERKQNKRTGANRFLQTLICIHFASRAFDLFLFSNCVVPHAREIDSLNLDPVISLFINVNTKEKRKAKRGIRCFPLESKNETHQSPRLTKAGTTIMANSHTKCQLSRYSHAARLTLVQMQSRALSSFPKNRICVDVPSVCLNLPRV